MSFFCATLVQILCLKHGMNFKNRTIIRNQTDGNKSAFIAVIKNGESVIQIEKSVTSKCFHIDEKK